MAVRTAAPTSAVAQRQRISVRKDNFVAGGILPEGDYDVVEAKYIIFQYVSKDNVPTGAVTTAFQMKLQPINAAGQPEGDAAEQIYSVGDPGKIAPSEDGNFLEAVGTSTTLSNQSNYFILFDNLINAGVPEDQFDDNGASFLVGMRGHITHIPAPDRTSLRERNAASTGIGMAAGGAATKRDQPKTIPVFKSISVAPWDKGGKRGAAKGPVPVAAAKRSTVPAPAAVAPEVEAAADDRLMSMVAEVIKAGGGTLEKTQVRLKTHQRYNAAKIPAAERDVELALFNDDAALEQALGSISCVLEDNGNKGLNITLVA